MQPQGYSNVNNGELYWLTYCDFSRNIEFSTLNIIINIS